MIKRALLVMDMQNDLCHDLRRRHKVERMVEPLTCAIDLFSRADHQVYYPCLSLAPDDPQFDRFGDRYCIEGTEGADVIQELHPLQGPVIFKSKHSAFFETQLDERLKAAGVSEVFLTGLQTHICIMTTAADASFRSYRVVAIRDCVLSTSEENRVWALDWIAKYVGEVRDLEGLVARGFDGD